MLIYVPPQYRSAVTLTRPVDVVCEKCGGRYRYRLERRSVGYAWAGPRVAEWTARRQAGRRLATDADLVACPDCGWFQSDMVAAARRRWGRWTLRAMWLVPLVSLVVVIGVWAYEMSGGTGRVTFAHLTPAERLRVVRAVVVAAATVVAVPPVRSLLASRINPNRGFPTSPGSASGGPTAERVTPPRWQSPPPRVRPVVGRPSDTRAETRPSCRAGGFRSARPA